MDYVDDTHLKPESRYIALVHNICFILPIIFYDLYIGW